MSPIPSLLLAALLFVSAHALPAAAPPGPVDLSTLRPPIRVACLGDSITYGVGAKPGWSWPEQLDRMLGPKWDVRNFGHSGATVSHEDKNSIWNQKEYREALLFHPDVAIVLLGTNDTKPEHWAKKEAFPKLYKDLVVSFQQLSSIPRVWCGTAPYVAKKGNFGINEPGVIEQIPMIRQAAGELGAGVVDIHAALLGRDELFKDNVHPSAEGATLIAKAVYQALTGQEWDGEIPGPLATPKEKLNIRAVENPGEITYRDLFAMVASEGGLTSDQMAVVGEKYKTTAPELEAKLHGLEDQIAQADKLRMKYKHTEVEAEKPLYSEYRGRIAALNTELARTRREANAELIALIPVESRGPFAAAWLRKYVTDRLAPLGSTVTPAQRQAIAALCQKAGPAYGAINNTPERSIAEMEAYKLVYQQVLDPEQKKRVEPR